MSDASHVSRYGVDIDLSNANTSHALLARLVGGAKRVLDVGCAEGDLARVLVAQGCVVTGVEYDAAAAEKAAPDLERLVVADLTAVDLTEELGEGSFDVVVLGDVLEHLPDPARTLTQARRLLAPDGFVAISLPNVAHAAVRLSLLAGRWDYRPLGLLDETHLRFFTRESLHELLRRSGFVALQVERTTAGPFETEQQVDPASVDPAVLAQVMADPDATTYQFVVTAVRDDASGRLLARAHEADALERALAEQTQAATRLAAERQVLENEARKAQHAAAAERDVAAAAQNELRHVREQVAAMTTSSSWRVTAPLRQLAPLRTALQGPPTARHSLRSLAGWRRSLGLLRSQGLRGAARSARDAGHLDAYTRWVQQHDTLTDSDRDRISAQIDTWSDPPTITVVVPTYNTSADLLTQTIASVQRQLYPHWQLVLVDDASPSDLPRDLASAAAARDPRVTALRQLSNGGIAEATNAGLAAATGAYIAFLDHDDLLAETALYLVVDELRKHPDAALVYTDEDQLDASGRRVNPSFKPDLNRDLLLQQNYINHLTVVRRDVLDQLGGLAVGLDGSQDHDLLLRVLEQVPPDQVRHVPRICYHWRAFAGSGSYSATRLEQATRSSRAAVAAHLHRAGLAAEVVPAPRNQMWNRVIWPVPDPAPAVTVVIPTRDRVDLLRRAVAGVLEHTDYPDVRVVIADNDSTDEGTLDYLTTLARDDRVTVLPSPGPFNYSAINNRAVAATDTPLVLLLNNDVVVREPGWLSEMVAHACRTDVGVVGAKLLYADGKVQHGGVILGIGGVAGHSHKHRPSSELGYVGRLILSQDLSAVTGACLLTHRSLWDELGGLNETELGVALSDVDYCLRVRETGRRVIWTPYAELDHLESASRGLENTPEKISRFARERTYMAERWGAVLDADPAYNPNLTVHAEDFGLAEPPRVARPWTG